MELQQIDTTKVPRYGYHSLIAFLSGLVLLGIAFSVDPDFMNFHEAYIAVFMILVLSLASFVIGLAFGILGIWREKKRSLAILSLILNASIIVAVIISIVIVNNAIKYAD